MMAALLVLVLVCIATSRISYVVLQLCTTAITTITITIVTSSHIEVISILNFLRSEESKLRTEMIVTSDVRDDPVRPVYVHYTHSRPTTSANRS